ncbi:MAG TPA: flagellar hook-associated protein FlgL [Polyangiaceae bacterium]|jgi:flagellar hook-associated protein 3 FlgL|nr:flagellar hook-associated protein FlgL [Polyangiaceae bacterium]
MRIADTTRFRNIQDQVARAQSQYTDAARQASSGLRVGAPSDDPVAAAQALRVSHSMARTASFRNTIASVRGDVELAESTLAGAEDMMQRLHDIALGASSGTLDPKEQSALATEVTQLKEQLLAFANQKGSMGYLFGGTKTQTAPFPGGAFIGDDLDRTAEVGQGVVMTVSTSGAKAFTAAGGRDIFSDVDALYTAITTDNKASLLASVNLMEAGSRQILGARAEAGIKMARLDAADATHEQMGVTLATQRHGLIEADPMQAYSALAQMQQQLEAAVTVSKNLIDILAATTAALR